MSDFMKGVLFTVYAIGIVVLSYWVVFAPFMWWVK